MNAYEVGIRPEFIMSCIDEIARNNLLYTDMVWAKDLGWVQRIWQDPTLMLLFMGTTNDV